jgi:UPF0716 protein FxsA
MRLLLLLFITVPITEMWLLIEVGSNIGALNTIALVFLTAVMGVALLRQQGLSTLMRVNEKVEQGQLPAAEILEGVMLAVGGVLLLVPGFATDAFGFACLLPLTRRFLVAGLLKRGLMMSAQHQGQTFTGSFEHNAANSASHDQQEPLGRVGLKETSSNVIDGEFRRED